VVLCGTRLDNVDIRMHSSRVDCSRQSLKSVLPSIEAAFSHLRYYRDMLSAIPHYIYPAGQAMLRGCSLAMMLSEVTQEPTNVWVLLQGRIIEHIDGDKVRR
jgi:hypothetical protein